MLMSLHQSLYFVGLYFLIGAIGTIIVNRNAEAVEKRKRWIKFTTYLIITYLLMFSILAGGRIFSLVAMAIVITGAFEIIRVNRKDIAFFLLATALLVCIVAGYGFIKFASLPAGLILYIYLMTVVFDGFSQLSGQMFGRHKLVQRISPNKTVEGLIGGTFCTIVSGCFIRHWGGFSLPRTICISFGLCLAALLGDLLASAYKRGVGIKDFSNIIPGHGGVLDRFDSFIATGACFYLYFLFL